MQFAAFADALITGGLVHKGHDTDTREAADKDFRRPGNIELLMAPIGPKREGGRLTSRPIHPTSSRREKVNCGLSFLRGTCRLALSPAGTTPVYS